MVAVKAGADIFLRDCTLPIVSCHESLAVDTTTAPRQE